ncbi:hypothetical protein [Nibrella saemangeumensis]
MKTLITPKNSSAHLIHRFATLKVFIVLMALWPMMSYSQFSTPGTAEQPATTLSLETDPAPYLYKGYSVSLRFSHKAFPHWSVMGSLFQGGVPDALLTKTNKELGWRNLRFSPSYALFVDYSLRQSGRGLFFGPAVFLYNNYVTLSTTGQRVDFRTAYPNVRIGYTIFPFKRSNLYITPWFNIGKEIQMGSNAARPEPTYQLSPVKYIMAVHLGYRFKFQDSSRR